MFSSTHKLLKLALKNTSRHLRPYWATITKDVEPVRARILDHPNHESAAIAELEIWEPYKYKYFYHYLRLVHCNYDASILQKSLHYMGFYDYVYHWGKKLSISSTGRIEDNISITSQWEKNPNPGQIISQEFFNFVADNIKCYRGSVVIYQHECIPDMLYAIPQVTWNNFIAKLPCQDIVKQLDLSTHRHLWKAYNYAASADSQDVRHFRADALSKYHFLTSLCNNSNHNRDKNSYNETTYIINGERRCRFTLNLDVKDLFNQIDQGKPPADILANRLPYMTPLFLNKFSHCSTWGDINSIGLNFILPMSLHEDGKTIDKIKLDEFIAALPSSKKSPLQFSEMIKCFRRISFSSSVEFMENGISSYYFYQSRKNFSLFKCDISELNDYFNALFKDLIYPEIVRQLLIMPQLLNLPSEQMKKMQVNDASDLIDKIISNIANEFKKQFHLVMAYSKATLLMSLQERWHRNITVIQANKPTEVYNDNEWYALFEDLTIDKVTFSCLTSSQQLHAEGHEMEHCVGGYAYKCLMDHIHIIKINTESGERATLHLEMNENNISIKQNKTKRNKVVSSEITNATSKLIELLNKNKDLLNPKCGSTAAGKKRKVAHCNYPYPFSDEAIQEQIYQAYKNAKVLPPALEASNYKEMLEKHKIIKFIQDRLPEIYQNKMLEYLRHNRYYEIEEFLQYKDYSPVTGALRSLRAGIQK